MNEQQAVVDELIAQRNDALNNCAVLKAKLSVANAKISELEAAASKAEAAE